jgi:multicomponent Na+:H+ antiporter subunit D
MEVVSWMPFWILMSSVVPGVMIFFLSDDYRVWRTALNMGGAVLKLILIGFMIAGLVNDQNYLFSLPLLPGMDLVLQADTMSVLIAALSSVLWFVTTLYAIAYLEDSPQPRSRFFGFFSLCVSATIGIALSGNLVTFLIFYELLTLSTYPLVVHRGNPPGRQRFTARFGRSFSS